MKTRIFAWIGMAALLASTAYLLVARQDLKASLESLRAENQELRQEAAERDQAEATAAQVQTDEIAKLRKDSQELLRLRNEIRQLRDEKQQLSRQVQSAQAQSQAALTQAQTAQAQAQALQAATSQENATARSAAEGGLTTEAMVAFRKRYGLVPDATAAQNMCINNLRHLDGAKQQWALENQKTASAVPTMTDLAPYLRNQVPACPSGGAYTLNSVGTSPSCGQPGHALPN